MQTKRLAARLLMAAALAAVVSLGAAAWRRSSAPRAWGPTEVPVAFWAWRDHAPAQGDVDRAAEATGARALFLRSGQLGLAGGRVERVRAVEGKFPRGVELHLVYNATPGLLAAFERVEEGALAGAAVETFAADAARAARDGAQVSGLQLDLDVPTRLLA
ncbi:MAG TPA: hypothetical protein VN282_00685, partial [Pyrinomonadaceae bacterium]|nr:hypothetical protein [Pyrinomonadaceae bacterium]